MSCFFAVLRLKSFFKNQPGLKTDLSVLYKQRFQNTIYYQACVSTLRFITPQAMTQFKSRLTLVEEDQQEPFQRRSSRKSVTPVSHYEQSSLSNNILGRNSLKNNCSRSGSISGPEGIENIPNTIQYLSINEKQQLLKGLIEKCYLYVDLSDLFTGQDLETYQNLVRKEIFQGQQSIVESIQQTSARRGVKNKLKYFDSEALYLLKVYVDFCTQIVEKIKPATQQNPQRRTHFLPRLILQLKASLQIKFPHEKVQNQISQINNLVKQYRVMNNIILSTIEVTEKIHIIPEESHQYAQNFFTHPNMSTLISVVMFMDQNFLKAMFDRFMEGLQLCSARVSEKLIMNQQKFVDKLKQAYFGVASTKPSRNHNYTTASLLQHTSNIQKMLQESPQKRFPYFRKSLRTLQTLCSQKQPLKSLKIIYELNRTIQKQHTDFVNAIIGQQLQLQNNMVQENVPVKGVRQSQYQSMRLSQKNKKYSFARETQYVIIQFLLGRKRDKLRFIVANIMMAYFFVHEHMLKDKKGSCLMPFVDIIQNYGIGIQGNFKLNQ